MSNEQSLYDQDFYAWAQRNAALLRAGRVEEADCEHLAEENEDLGKAQRHALRSHLRQLIAHLLKLDYSPAEQPRRGWFEEVQNARAEIADRLADSPSLTPQVDSILAEVWQRARRQACDARSPSASGCRFQRHVLTHPSRRWMTAPFRAVRPRIAETPRAPGGPEQRVSDSVNAGSRIREAHPPSWPCDHAPDTGRRHAVAEHTAKLNTARPDPPATPRRTRAPQAPTPPQR